MKYTIEILRQRRNEKTKYIEKYEYNSDNLEISLLQVLLDINLKYNANIEFEYSCYQKKCGACSAIINNTPKLLCSAKLKDYKENIFIEPLRKFNCIVDLIVDRSILYENLKTLNLWLNENANINDENTKLAYKASECIMCGLCLEVCPSFNINSKFFGPQSFSITTKIVTEADKETKDIIKEAFKKHIFSGCSKTLSCVKVCPKNIKLDELLVNLNGLSIWK